MVSKRSAASLSRSHIQDVLGIWNQTDETPGSRSQLCSQILRIHSYAKQESVVMVSNNMFCAIKNLTNWTWLFWSIKKWIAPKSWHSHRAGLWVKPCLGGKGSLLAESPWCLPKKQPAARYPQCAASFWVDPIPGFSRDPMGYQLHTCWYHLLEASAEQELAELDLCPRCLKKIPNHPAVWSTSGAGPAGHSGNGGQPNWEVNFGVEHGWTYLDPLETEWHKGELWRSPADSQVHPCCMPIGFSELRTEKVSRLELLSTRKLHYPSSWRNNCWLHMVPPFWTLKNLLGTPRSSSLLTSRFGFHPWDPLRTRLGLCSTPGQGYQVAGAGWVPTATNSHLIIVGWKIHNDPK